MLAAAEYCGAPDGLSASLRFGLHSLSSVEQVTSWYLGDGERVSYPLDKAC